MSTEEDKIKKLTDELNLYKKKAARRRQAIKYIERKRSEWEKKTLGLRFQLVVKQREFYSLHQTLFYIAKQRAIEVGLIESKNRYNIVDLAKVSTWLEQKIREYKEQNGEFSKEVEE